MKHIRNNGRYDFSFTALEGSKEKKVVFARKRVYMDTGNIAVDGITAVEDDLFNELNKIKQFKAMFSNGTFEVVDPSAFAKKEDDKDREIAELRAKLAESNTSEMEEALKAKDDEIASLKAKLEAKANKNKGKPEVKADETKAEETKEDEVASDEESEDETKADTEGF